MKRQVVVGYWLEKSPALTLLIAITGFREMQVVILEAAKCALIALIRFLIRCDGMFVVIRRECRMSEGMDVGSAALIYAYNGRDWAATSDDRSQIRFLARVCSFAVDLLLCQLHV